MNQNTCSRGFTVVVFGVLCTMAVGCAQAQHRVTRTPTELLAAFEHDYDATGKATSAGSLDLTYVLMHHTEFPSADVEALLQGLERIALVGDASPLRAAAVLRLVIPGSLQSRSPVPNMMGRLERIYQGTNDPLVRSSVVSSMAELAQRQAALRFLEKVAVQAPEAADFPGSASRALGTLVAMGDEGREVLRRLHESEAIRDPEARYELSVLASRGYRLK